MTDFLHPAVLVNLASFLMMFLLFAIFFLRYRKQFQGIIHWSLFFLLQFTGMLLFLLRDFIPLNLSIFFTNLMFLFSLIFFSWGLRRFFGLALPRFFFWIHGAAFSVFFFIILFFAFVHPCYGIRVLSFCIFNLAYFIGFLRFFNRFKPEKKQYRGFQAFFIFLCLIMAVRIVNVLSFMLQGQPFNPKNPIETLFTIFSQFSLIFLGFLLIQLFHRRLMTQLQDATQKKDLLFSIVSHDLRSPLYSLAQLNQLLLSEKKSLKAEEWKEYFQLYQQTLSKTADLADTLLNWALHEQDYKPEVEKIQIASLIQKILPLMNEKIQAKRIQMMNEIPENLYALTGENILETLLRNLISNAVKYTPEGGRITFEAEKNGKQNQIRITDTGVGMTPEKIKEIFEIRHKAPVAGTGGESGSGIGLALSSQLFQKILGHIQVESRPKEGSRFILTFPDLSPGDFSG